MEKIVIEIAVEKIQEAFVLAADEVFKSTYSNPVKKLLEEALTENKGEIKKLVDGIISQALTSPEFKEKVTDAVVSGMVKSAIGNR